MKERELRPEILPQHKVKNRGWKAALDAQFPSFMSSMSQPKTLALAVVLLLLGSGACFVGTRTVFRVIRAQRLQQVESTIKSCEQQLAVLIQEEGRSWFMDKKVEFIKSKLAALARQERKNFYGFRAATLLSAHALQHAQIAYERRIALVEAVGAEPNLKKRVPLSVQKLPLAPALAQTFDYPLNSDEDQAYQEAKYWTQYALQNAPKEVWYRDWLLARMARICTALGEFEEAQEHLKIIQQPLRRAWAYQTQMEIFYLTGDWDSARECAERIIEDLKNLESSVGSMPQETYVRLENLRRHWELRLEVLEGMKKVSA